MKIEKSNNLNYSTNKSERILINNNKNNLINNNNKSTNKKNINNISLSNSENNIEKNIKNFLSTGIATRRFDGIKIINFINGNLNYKFEMGLNANLRLENNPLQTIHIKENNGDIESIESITITERSNNK